MPEITPFKGIVYAADLRKEASTLLCPPYDAISPARQKELYDLSSSNAVRVELPMEEDPYEAASARLGEWLNTGILEQDALPALYPCQQTFEDENGVSRTRRGFFAALRLYDAAEGEVLPHERTLTGPKADRLSMFRKTGMNVSSIFGLYDEASRHADSVVRGCTDTNEPLVDAMFDGVRNRMWRVTDPATIEAVQSDLGKLTVYIADGHHRYETGVAYRNERASANPAHTGNEPYNFILAYLVNIHDEGLLVQPIHRLVHGLEAFSPEAFIARLERCFSVWELPGRKGLEEFLGKQRLSSSFGIVLPGLVLGISLDCRPEETLSGEVPQVLRSLDVVILHELIFGRMLGISATATAREEHITYVKSWNDVFERVAEGKVQMGIVLRPAGVEQVIAVAGAGEVMPQKSTWFHPKVMTGMVFHALGTAV